MDVNHRGRTIKGGVQLWHVGTDTAKSLLFNYIASDEESVPEDRFIRFPAGLADEYFEQLTAEVYDAGKSQWRKLPGRRNEVIDLFVYGFAAAYHPLVRLDTMRDADWAQLESLIEPVNGDLFAAPLTPADEPVPAAEETEPGASPPASAPAPAAVVTPAAPAAQDEQPLESSWLSGTDNWLD
jgi:phage terminase large subunit GpA-like protein